MKVGILTLHRAINYGAVWQCWALKRMCEQLGHDVELIDYVEKISVLGMTFQQRIDLVCFSSFR